MPDFRRLFFIAKVLTCCCCCSRRKPGNARGPNHPYGTRHDQPTGSSSENTSDYSEYSVPPAYPGGPVNLIHPDEFEIPDELNEVHGRDDFGFDLKKSRSLVPCPPTPRPSSPATSEPATTRPSTAKPDTMRPSTAESTTTKTISDEPAAGPSVIAETTAAESVTERPHADEPGTPKPVVVEPITDNTSVDKSVTAEPEATGSTTKRLVADETGATKSVVTEPKLDAEPGEPGPTETKTDRPKFVSVDLAEAGPRKSDIEASEVKDGTTEASSGGVGPTENKDEDKGKDKVSE
ncbi:hypothetical protein H9Q69_001084 [Fusarium xylarioides]|uniref:Uncharacterized protein n=1 Tax=Fusarium xylarioides TaxID=221167 RepID=A0A9P7I547_9HYPO|nr:hypothetical protein H9Q70_001085 [Fusarium xylarioides]KAG5774372.1 hypothetical protein H9Q72_000260 [Fusarium xylarioides]KAG5786008.1 hypothetical protein H9Q73_000308 [Fusarium xylarioides]KAG5799880.1 hypothetical protein H9Q69_001084 [Fusarium xylarioides]KAG5816124.1 hypothetical protein H9Q71_002473 [Fusarium xylarioides]